MRLLNSSVRTLLSPVFLAFLVFLPIELRSQTKQDCLMCHSEPSMTMEKEGREVSIFTDETVLNRSVHGRMVCVACHVGFSAEEIPHKPKIDPVNCATCHKDAPVKHRFHPQMVRATGIDGKPDVSCKQCHGTHDVVSTRSKASRFHVSKLTESCSTCHNAVKETYVHSSHSKAFEAGVKGAPSCIVCHQNAITRLQPGQDSTQLKIAQERLCLSCHLDNPEVRARTAPSAGFIAAYEQSVHGAALLRGNSAAANCIDCHGSHEMTKGSDPSSLVAKNNIPTTCAKCHGEIAEEYRHGVHFEALLRGNKDAPVCTDCHGEHNILGHTDPRSRVAAGNVSAQVCSPCHSSLRLSEKYGISSDRFQTFADSYHGLAIRAGSVEVANCASCHGAHKILPSINPASSVHKENLAATCGSCHPGANERFAMGSVHVLARSEEEPVLYFVSTLYITLIVVVIGGMVFHNAVDFVKRARRRLMIRRGLVPEEPLGHRLYLRMTLSERLQHGTLAISFITLVITGFMLRYPEAWWVVWIRGLSDSVFDLRGLLHRVAAVVLIAASLYHLYYIFFTERGKQLIRDLLPRIKDIYDAIAVLKYNLGISREKPLFGRFSYIEKSEYWALVWGTVVMALTGFILWFDNTFMGLLTKLGWDVARTIHFYEAWLATLAIIVWHFYYVMFNPDVYPMNLAWLTGTLTEAEMAEEHPLELEEIRRREMMKELGEEEAEPVKERQTENEEIKSESGST